MIFKIISAVKIRVKTWKEEKETQQKVTEKVCLLMGLTQYKYGVITPYSF